jgi:hypothetical protein
MDACVITDIRTIKDFKGVTFSNFKKSDCKNLLIKSLIQGSIEPSCYWSIQYICAGHFLDLWDIILLFISKYIHLGNPRIALYIEMRYGNFRDIVHSGYGGNELELRNNNKIRILFAEVICILCLSVKKHNLSKIKVDKKCFDMSNITEKLQADNVEYAKSFFNNGDPKELFIALNELAYHIKSTRSSMDACFWLEWILEFEAICKKDKKHALVANSRYLAPIDSKYASDIIWIVWELLISEASIRNDATVIRVITSFMNLFSIQYNNGCKRKRRFILYNAISLLTDSVNYTIPIYKGDTKIKNVKEKIHLIYKDIKKGEMKPATDYLFNNSITGAKSNVENTMSKLGKMDSINTIIHRQ